MAKISGTVKWFSNKKGFGFLAPTSENAPTSDEIFVHHSSLQMVEGAYRTLAEGSEVEFEVEKDDSGKLKAINVTGKDGALLEPPSRDKKRIRKPKAGGNSGDEKTSAKSDKPNGKGKGEKKAAPTREAPFHSVIPDDLKAKISEKGVKLVRNTVDVALGGSRIKLGQGGYASIVDAKGVVGEGSYTCDESAKISFNWEKSLVFEGGAWKLGDVSKLLGSLSLADDAITTVGADETPEKLWGSDKPDPKDMFAEHGFKMKKVILSRPRSSRYRGNKSD
ncbi:cold shock domain protein A [Fistulifera solaris]|uniref:Cold shock domain protein A n=1 Tax=Fistulifera solaris TaxID=1519565 RepID=A0A1Z5KH56_FISSO|nr:cold shock domain protein A [Fistulifera solaris]|eukprot:GAX25412.1 cold shock domain protein A [Fistulifera solaris]